MSGSVTGGSSRRPGSTDGPPSRFQRESLIGTAPPQSCGSGGSLSGTPWPWLVRRVSGPGAHSWKFHL